MSDQIQPSTIAGQAPTVPLSPQEVLSSHQPLSSLTNQQFYVKCVRIGSTAKTAVREFLALLPEAEDRKVYLEHGMSSIVEFASKLGGVSKEQVQRVLQLNDRFESVPILKQALVSGDISLAKLARVASVATPQNQEFWITQAKLLSQPALETLVRDSKATTSSAFTLHSVRSHTSNPNKTAKVGQKQHTVQKIAQSDELHLSPEIRDRLLTLQNKGLDLNQVLGDLLDQREQRIQEEKEEIANELEQPFQTNTMKSGVNKHSSRTIVGNEVIPIHSVSRYIPMKIKQIIKQEYGEKCAHSNCTNKSVNTHHLRRFGLDPSHDPAYLAPLCKQHHEIAHSIDVRVMEKRSITTNRS